MVGPEQVPGEFLVPQASHCLQSRDPYQAHFKAVSGTSFPPILQAPPAETQPGKTIRVRRRDALKKLLSLNLPFFSTDGAN
jgi:hypothetical protein